MNSINSILGKGAGISYSNLKSITNGTYNKGEVVAKKGFFGGYSFGKVNNHMTKVGKNTVVTSDADNRITNAAVFKAMLTRFGKGNETAVNELLSTDLDKVSDALLAKFDNPYIKEAFKFLLGDCNDNRPVSRDEVHVLLLRLKEAEQQGGRHNETTVRKNMDDLEVLRTFKITGRVEEGTDTAVYNGLKGVVHADYGTAERAVLFAPTANQISQTPRVRMEKHVESVLTLDLRLLRAFTPTLFNTLYDRLASAAVKYKGKELADFKKDNFALVDELVNGLVRDLGPELENAADSLTSGLAEFKRSAAYQSAMSEGQIELPDGTKCRKLDVEFWEKNPGVVKTLAREGNQTPAAKKQVMLLEIKDLVSRAVTMTCLGHDRPADEVDRDGKDLFALQGEIALRLVRQFKAYGAEQA